MHCDLAICPTCGDDVYEISCEPLTPITEMPADGDRATWVHTLSCGDTYSETLSYFGGWPL